jgi:DNA-binding NtrC family response regulator
VTAQPAHATARPGRSLDELVARVAPSRVSVVITGETGSGKDVLARKIHAASPRAARPFVSVNCAAFCESLLDSELFGHQKGAFTGAEHSRAGLIEAADGGTLFLDELGELSPPAQAKLLRTIETRFVTRVGSTSPHLVDVRFVAATHRDLEIAVQTGRLRADLLYRLDGVRIHLPPLRERAADILPAAESFLDELARREGIARPTLTEEARRLLATHDWPGNFRELRNVVERAAIVCDRAVIEAEDLLISSGEDRRLSSLREPTTRPGGSLASPTEANAPAAAPAAETGAARAAATRPRDLRTAGGPTEGERIRSALSSCAGNQTRAAKLLGISRRTLITRLEQHGIPRPRAGRLRQVAAAKI